MRKLFSLIAAVLFAGSMMATPYTLTFNYYDNAGSDKSAAETTLEGLFDEASMAYVDSAFNGVILEKVYLGRKYKDKVSGDSIFSNIKFGTSSAAGTLKFALKNMHVDSVIFRAAMYGDAEGGDGFSVNGTAFTLSAGNKTFENLTYVPSAAINSLEIVQTKANKGRFYLTSITVYPSEGVVPPTPVGCNWDEIAFLGNGSGNAAYTDRFKVCAGDPAPTSIVNIQAPGWAAEPGIYVTFPSAAFGAISLDASQYAIDGAGIVLYVSAFLYDAEKEVTIVCDNVTYTLTVKNANPEVAPVETITCAEVYNKAKNDEVALNDVTVTYVNGKNVWVKDATASMLLYLSADATWAAGDVLSGVVGVVDIYKGLYEVKPNADQVAAVVATAGEAPAAEELAVITEATDVNKYIVLKNVAVSGAFESNKLTMTVGENTYELYNKFNSNYAFDATKTYNITGIVSIYNTLQVLFIDAEDVTPVEPETIPTVAPAVPAHAEADVMGVYCSHYTVNNAHFGISGWAGAYQTLDLSGTAVGYWDNMTWECIIDPANTDAAHDFSAYENIHIDMWAPQAAKIKFTAEAFPGGGYKDGIVVDLAQGWNNLDFALSEFPGNYDFSTLKCFVFEQYQTPAGESFEHNPFAFANLYFWNASGSTIKIDIESEVQYTDYVAQGGWWQFMAENKDYSISISNIYTTQAAGTYTVADLDADYSYIFRKADSVEIAFVEGSFVLTEGADGSRTIQGVVTGDDSNVYDIKLVFRIPTPQTIVDVQIPQWGVLDAAEIYGYTGTLFYGEAADSTYIQFVVLGNNPIGTFTYDDMLPSATGIEVGGEYKPIYSMDVTVNVSDAQRAIVTADILCLNNTLYRVTTISGEGVDNINAAVKAIKRLVNGNVVIEKAGVRYSINGQVIR